MSASPHGRATTTHVRIFGAEYPIRSHEGADYVRRVAETVEQAMHRVSRNKVAKSTADVAILAAMNIADELFRTRRQLHEVLRRVGDTTDAMGQVLDDRPPVVTS